MNQKFLALSLIVGAAFTTNACVSKGKHADTLASLAATQESLDARELTLSEAIQRIEELESQRLDTDTRLATCERTVRHSMRESEELSRLLVTTRSSLADAQGRLNSLESSSRQSQSQSAEERARLESERQVLQNEREALLRQLNVLQAESRERQRLYDEMMERFRSLIDAGQLSVTLVNGRLVINMPQDILFGSGSASLSREGETALLQVAAVLRDFRDRNFQVEGHSDNVPINTSRFPSNWELSSARAISVVHVLQRGGVTPQSLSGAGFGEYHPVAPNDTRENRTKNRRIEIVIVPNLSEFAPIAN